MTDQQTRASSPIGRQILVTGGSGLIGSALTRTLIKRGYRVIILSRRPVEVGKRFGDGVTVVGNLNQIDDSHSIDRVVNLAGAQIVGKRWSKSRKKTLWQSRIDLTRELVNFMARRPTPPEVLISGSAIGYYGDSEDRVLDESAAPGNDFGAKLCVAWEQEALRAEQFGSRVCLIRTGLVLSTDGGMLEQMLLPFKLCLGARLGDGTQWMSWIHIADEVAAIVHLLESEHHSGPFNLTAPTPVTNRKFTQSLGTTLNRPTLLAIPEILIKLGLGESALLLLGGQRAKPQQLMNTGFEFRHSGLDAALAHLLR